MSIDRKFPINVDSRTKSILEAIYNAIDELQKRPATTTLSAEDRRSLASQAATQAAGLLGPFATPVLGQTATDPALQGIPTGNGTVTSASRVNNTQFLTVTVTLASTTPVFTFDANPATGWGAPSSTLARTTFATYAGQTCSVGYVQAEVQATDDAVKAVSQRLGGLITDLLTKGILHS